MLDMCGMRREEIANAFEITCSAPGKISNGIRGRLKGRYTIVKPDERRRDEFR
jgi:hypothetical protein